MRFACNQLETLLGGDFTPVREPLITFDTLVLDNGTRIPIDTSVEAGTDMAIRFNGGLDQGERLKGSLL